MCTLGEQTGRSLSQGGFRGSFGMWKEIQFQRCMSEATPFLSAVPILSTLDSETPVTGLNYYLHFDDAQSGVCERVEASLLDFFLDLLWLKIWVGSEKRIDKLEQEEI